MQANSLFRHQVVVAQQQRVHGQILLRPRVSFMAMALCLFIWLCAALYWLWSGNYTYTQSVTGWLEPASGITHVYSPQPGTIVDKILVSANTVVDAGVPLAKLRRDAVFSINQHAGALQTQKIKQHIQRLQSQRDLTSGHFHQQIAQQEAYLVTLQADHQQLLTMKALQLKKRDLVSKQKSAIDALVKAGHASEQQQSAIQTQWFNEHYHYEQLSREVIQNNADQQAVEFKHRALRQQQALALLDIENQISEQQNRLNQHLSTQDIIVVAPVRGRISQWRIHEGQESKANLPLLSLMPEHATVEARLLIPVSAAGFIEQGQTLQLRYDAFPYTQFGSYEAQITELSDHLMLPQEVAQTPIQPEKPVYLASAQLTDTHIRFAHQSLALRAGMTFVADIKIRERNLLQWLFEPIYALRGDIL